MYRIVRVQDRLMYFMKAIGRFSTDTVRGLIYMYAHGFITITRVSHPLHIQPFSKKVETWIILALA